MQIEKEAVIARSQQTDAERYTRITTCSLSQTHLDYKKKKKSLMEEELALSNLGVTH